MKITNKNILKGILALSVGANILPIQNTVMASSDNIVDNINIDFVKGDKGDNLKSIIKTNDGGFLILYNSSSTNLNHENTARTDGFLVKCNSSGEKEWLKTFGGNGYDDFVSITQLKDNSFVIAGKTDSSDLPNFTLSGENHVIIHLTEEGEIIKGSKIPFSSSNWHEEIVKVVGLSDGGFIVLSKNCIYKYNSNFESQYTIDNFYYENSMTNTYADIIELSDGNFIVTGNFSDGYGGGRAELLKFNSDGERLWHKKYPSGEDMEYWDRANKLINPKSNTLIKFNKVIEDSNGNLIVVGGSDYTDQGYSNYGQKDAIIAKYDSNGNHIKTVNFGGEKYDDEFYNVAKTADGGYIAVGTKGYEGPGPVMVKFNKDLGVEWHKTETTGFEDYYENTMDEIIILENGSIIAGGTLQYSTTWNDIIIMSYIPVDEIKKAIEELEANPTEEKLSIVRRMVNEMPEGDLKEGYQARLNAIEIDVGLSKKNATANVDIYIKTENMLKLTLSTNSISFDDFSGVTDMVKPNALELTVSSSLPYQVDAYLATEIQNADKSKTMNKEILKIKANEKGEDAYASFVDVNNTPITLLDEQDADNDVVHGIDFKLVGGDAFEKDVYKTTIKFEVKQK